MIDGLLEFFSPSDLLPPEQAALGENAVDLYIPVSSQKMILAIRLKYGKALFVNSGGLQFCGWRPKNCKTGAKNSPHKKGLAFDIHCKDISELAAMVRKHWKSLGVTRIENPEKTKTWLHVDCLPTGKNYLVEFDP